jgi:hypothetical protein
MIAQISVCSHALADSNQLYQVDAPLPPLPIIAEDSMTAWMASHLLRSLFMVDFTMPGPNELQNHLTLPGVQLSGSSIKLVVRTLMDWIAKSLDVLKTDLALQSGRFPKDYLLRMARALWFIRASRRVSPSGI